MLRIYDTRELTKKRFKPSDPSEVKMYVCGPTVYARCHVGHARTYIVYDIMRRYLSLKGYRVNYVMNITDIDDRILESVKVEKRPPLEIASHYLAEFYKDLKSLKITGIRFVRASDCIAQIIEKIQILLEKDFAYKVNGIIFFNTSKTLGYGLLSHQTAQDLDLRRLELDPKKRSSTDFSLWRTFNDSSYTWDSPFGRGRPGWHIEDTAIIHENLGDQVDIHGGAVDLIYPHHEAEIVQAEALTGRKPLAKFWVHSGLLYIRKKKMSKSLGNYVTIQEILKLCSPEGLRYYILKTHYRKPMSFSENDLIRAEKQISKLLMFYRALSKTKNNSGKVYSRSDELIVKFRRRFHSAMEDDFDSPKALGVISEFVSFLKHKTYSYSELRARRVLKEFFLVLGLLETDKS